MVPVFMIVMLTIRTTIRNMPPLAFGIHNEQYDCDVVIIVGTETTQGFTVGITTQVPSGRVWETQPFDVTLDTLKIQPPGYSCFFFLFFVFSSHL